MKVAGVVLAAGSGSRLGRPKAEVTVGGVRLVDLAVEACLGGGLSPVVVVLGAAWVTPRSLEAGKGPGEGKAGEGEAGKRKAAKRGAAESEAGEGQGAEVWLVHNAEWATGMASSLRAGLAALEDHHGIDAAVITLVDTPAVGADHLRRVGSSLRDGATAAVATYEGRPRTPVGLTRAIWADVALTAAGDEGARRWLRAHPQHVTEVECADLGPWTDIDTPADLTE